MDLTKKEVLSILDSKELEDRHVFDLAKKFNIMVVGGPFAVADAIREYIANLDDNDVVEPSPKTSSQLLAELDSTIAASKVASKAPTVIGQSTEVRKPKPKKGIRHTVEAIDHLLEKEAGGVTLGDVVMHLVDQRLDRRRFIDRSELETALKAAKVEITEEVVEAVVKVLDDRLGESTEVVVPEESSVKSEEESEPSGDWLDGLIGQGLLKVLERRQKEVK